MRHPLRLAIRDAERLLTAAGVDSPRVDAELLAAHVLGVERGTLVMVPLVDSSQVDELAGLVRRRAAREPLQHLTGTAAMGALDVLVGPGVFVPRPETELLLEWGLAALDGVTAPVVVDLCTGSGVLALAVAQARPDAVVHAVELDSSALAWARRNSDVRVSAGDTPIRLHHGDVTDRAVLSEMDGQVDLVLCNPPYVPEGTEVPPEVSTFDPAHAVFSGPDGLTVIRSVVSLAARLLRPGAPVAIEHDDTHGESVPALLRARRVLTDVRAHTDLAGRPRFATAVRATS
ncbi:peptide chain release factor N(5)-glutamine methyltransferase [Actinokineospora globicatena]|uniref:peptide chain release factor N(5)-glutamine methyltransferase n=1 Tax=Actinokineospora globicatena TaxID=103729 RepID=UPI0020A26AF1|nr:peptide chain release factor N(5)-glutamine methyltransferase [Actinokineospora globicatena]MCP2302431.1 release factor glutamine methyltransferase [Actinokineospora globicatena]GLW75889.1 release factor glutamine methyltransferase [Actinokineospora globicatena]GLW82727.1 release factor glutamine methyltransferase [Actinokineospora globicatena]